LEHTIKLSSLQFDASGKPEHLEQAIYLNRTLLDRLSIKHSDCDEVIKCHLRLQGSCFNSIGVALKLETSTCKSGRLPFFHNLTTSLPELSVKPISKIIFNKHKNTFSLYAINRLTNIADIEDGVNYFQQVLASYPNH